MDAAPTKAIRTPAHRSGLTRSPNSSAANMTDAGAQSCIATIMGGISVASFRPID